MELALFHPLCGYYTKPRSEAGPAGVGGDFITAPTASPLFAATMGRLLESLAARAGNPLTLVEIGAGEGLFLESLGKVLAAGVVSRTVAVEVAGWARERLARRCPHVESAASLADVTRPSGSVVLFASELYDAMPVDRVTLVRRGGQLVLQEYFVEVENGERLRWVLDDPEDPAAAGYLQEIGVVLEENQVAEVRPELRSTHAEHLAWCGHDAVALVVEYGHAARRLFDPRVRRQGSLVGYRGHRMIDDVLADPGSMDITAHVNFDDLESAAADIGWDRGELQPLGLFLALHGAVMLLPSAREGALSPREWAELAAAKKLLLPSGMGSDLKVLAQGRGRLWQLYRSAATPPPTEA